MKENRIQFDVSNSRDVTYTVKVALQGILCLTEFNHVVYDVIINVKGILASFEEISLEPSTPTAPRHTNY